MGDSFKREFSLGQVDTGTPYDQSKQLQPGQSIHHELAYAPGSTMSGNPLNYDPSVAGSGADARPASHIAATIARPSFLSAFLQNLGPALAGSMQAPRGSGVAGGLAGGFAGISKEEHDRLQEQFQQQQLDTTRQSLNLRTAQEMEMQRLHEEQIKNLSSLIETRANPPAKSQLEEYSRDYADALTKGDQAGAQAVLGKIQALTAAKTPPKPPVSPWGKLSPEMAAVGVPPNPNDATTYPQGQKDPKFLSDVQAYGQKVTDLKQANSMKLTLARGQGFAQARAQYQMIPVLDKSNDNQLTFVSAMDLAKNKSQYEPASLGASLGAKEAMFQDMTGASQNLKDAYLQMIKNGEKFTAGQVAKMTVAMKDDPSGGMLKGVIDNLSIAKAKDSLTPTQQRIAIALQQNVENAFALRGVAGMGQGSEQLRGAIKNTLASLTSPPEYALAQIAAYDAQRERIHRGIPNVNIRGGANTPPAGAKVLTLDQFLNQQ